MTWLPTNLMRGWTINRLLIGWMKTITSLQEVRDFATHTLIPSSKRREIGMKGSVENTNQCIQTSKFGLLKRNLYRNKYRPLLVALPKLFLWCGQNTSVPRLNSPIALTPTNLLSVAKDKGLGRVNVTIPLVSTYRSFPVWSETYGPNTQRERHRERHRETHWWIPPRPPW